ncbi:MAG: copper oxidase [Acidobacteria bacterium]|nr:copper oxidase [Acidobacteriota bacterium]
MANRRSFLQSSLGIGAGLFASRAVAEPTATSNNPTDQVAARGGYLGYSSGSLSKVGLRGGTVANTPVVTTDIGDLPFEMDGDVKVFRLTAHVFKRQIAPNKTIDVWGYNGSAPGPTIQVTQGDKVRVILKNELPEATSMHWHGFEDQIGYDGMPGISQEPIRPGQSFTYNFTIKQEGTYFYHSHMAMQELAGMLGAFIMHPKVPYRPHCDKDFAIHLQEYAVLPNATTPNTMMMEFNWLLLNGKAGPASTPLIVRQGERVRVRFVNLGMDHHPMHIHGHTFYVTGTEGGRIPETAWWPGNTVLVGVAQSRTIEFVADNPGDWMLHCHLPHHMMNQMAPQVGPMTRMAGFPGGQGMRGDDSSGRMTPRGTNPDEMKGMDMGQMQGMDMSHAQQASMPTVYPKAATDPAVPSAAFGAGKQATAPDGPLANTQLDAGMVGMMNEQMNKVPKLSQEQQRDLDAFDMGDSSMTTQEIETSPNANNVPNFPQDAYMEGPMMNMEKLVDKPENLGLRPNWSRFMQGMMTFVRVLPPDQYDQVVAAMRDAKRPGDPYASLYKTSDSGARG